MQGWIIPALLIASQSERGEGRGREVGGEGRGRRKRGSRVERQALECVQSLSRVQLFATPWTAACQAPLSFTVSWSLLKFMSTESVMPSSHLILCHLLLFLPSVFPSTRVFSNELAVLIGWPQRE